MELKPEVGTGRWGNSHTWPLYSDPELTSVCLGYNKAEIRFFPSFFPSLVCRNCSASSVKSDPDSQAGSRDRIFHMGNLTLWALLSPLSSVTHLSCSIFCSLFPPWSRNRLCSSFAICHFFMRKCSGVFHEILVLQPTRSGWNVQTRHHWKSWINSSHTTRLLLLLFVRCLPCFCLSISHQGTCASISALLDDGIQKATSTEWLDLSLTSC